MEAEAIYDTQKKRYEESYQSRLEREKYESISLENDVTDSLRRKSAPAITSISEDVFCKLGSPIYMDCCVAGKNYKFIMLDPIFTGKV